MCYDFFLFRLLHLMIYLFYNWKCAPLDSPHLLHYATPLRPSSSSLLATPNLFFVSMSRVVLCVCLFLEFMYKRDHSVFIFPSELKKMIGVQLITTLCQFQVYSKMDQIYIYICISPLFFFRLLSHVDHHRVWRRVPCAMQQVPISHLFHIQQSGHVSSNISTHPSPIWHGQLSV